MTKDDLLTPLEVAEMCGVQLNTVKVWRRRRVGPAFERIEGVRGVRYRRSVVETFLAGRRR